MTDIWDAHTSGTNRTCRSMWVTDRITSEYHTIVIHKQRTYIRWRECNTSNLYFYHFLFSNKSIEHDFRLCKREWTNISNVNNKECLCFTHINDVHLIHIPPCHKSTLCDRTERTKKYRSEVRRIYTCPV